MKKLFALCLALLTPVVFAHPGHGVGLAAGFAHPLTGLDHILCMVAIGLWAGQNSGRVRWTIMATFPAMMLLGGLLGVSGLNIGCELGIALSVAVMGTFVAVARTTSQAEAGILVSVIALVHGYAHGVEMEGSSFAAYGLGYSAASILLLFAGLGLSVYLQKIEFSRLVRCLGAAIACCTLLLV
jgi:urease accessory protein